MKKIVNEPVASVLMTSMRSMGYTFESAIADVIDNSISANAKNITVEFPIDENDIFMYILDDGHGMSYDELFDAMKYGSIMKIDGRKESDLGRFGVGLKSASLSQCRKLTVISKKNGEINGFCWDMDHIEETNEWEMIGLDVGDNNIQGLDQLLNQENGTLVVWENFDLLKKSSTSVYLSLIDYREALNKHISLIFHRFIEDGIVFRINNYVIKGLDPFLEKHNKTNIQREIKIPIKDSKGIERYVVATPYILPYQNDMKKTDIEKVGGIDNYKDQQGFYLYRNKRLIIWGTWFGYKKQELTKNARIKIDIPNTLDDIWSIDIKKQSAKIPTKIKKQLTNAILDTMGKAKKIHEYRGRIENSNESIDYLWNRVVEREGVIRYELNNESMMFETVKNKVDSATWRDILTLFNIVSAALPIQQIYLDKANEKTVNEDSQELENELITTALSIAEQFKINDKNKLIELLNTMEMFRGKTRLLNKIGEKI